MWAVLWFFLGILILVAMIVAVLDIVSMWKVFQKAGKQGWEAIVPYYNTWVLCEIAGVKWWFFLLMNAVTISLLLGLFILSPLTGIVSLLATFAVNYNIAIKFGKDPVGYGIGLTLVPIIFYPILAFGKCDFNDVKVSSYGPLAEDKVDDFVASNFGNESKQDETKKETKKTSKKKAKFCTNCGALLGEGRFCSNCGHEIH